MDFLGKVGVPAAKQEEYHDQDALRIATQALTQ